MEHQAQVTGKVESRQGDGTNILIRLGPIDVETTLIDATLSWTDGDTHGSTAMPIDDFRAYVHTGVIVMQA